MSRALILGSVSGKRLMDLSPIGVVEGQPIYPLRGAESDADDGGEENAEGNDSSEDDEDSDDSEEDEDKKSSKDSGKRRQSGQRNSEFALMRRELNALKREKAANEKKERDRELADKPEIERLSAEKEDTVKERDGLRERHNEAIIELEIIKVSSRGKKYDWNDIEDVLNDRSVRRAIEINEDGDISGVEDALKDLAKRKPHFLASKSDKDSDDKAKSNGKASTNGAGTGKTGAAVGNGSTGDRTSDRASLEKKYPTLAHMIEN